MVYKNKDYAFSTVPGAILESISVIQLLEDAASRPFRFSIEPMPLTPHPLAPGPGSKDVSNPSMKALRTDRVTPLARGSGMRCSTNSISHV